MNKLNLLKYFRMNAEILIYGKRVKKVLIISLKILGAICMVAFTVIATSLSGPIVKREKRKKAAPA